MLNEILLASRYRLIQSLGKGAFGKTYLAEDTLLPGQPQCVVKKLNPHIDNAEYLHLARRLFKQEAEALHKLGHWDKIPTLHAYFEEDTEFYLVQQYIPGNPLSKELIPRNVWTEAKVLQLLEEVLQVLKFIHSESVIHRDIKPSNLIRRQSDRKLVLVDFGAVKEVIISQTNIASNLTIGIGTKGYMSSEQIRGKPRFNSDIYALGIIGIQALTGMNPNEFVEDEDGEIIWKDLVNNVNPKLIEIISKMTRYHFQERYQSAEEVIQDLECDCNSILTVEENTEFSSMTSFLDNTGTWLDLPIQDSTIHINRENRDTTKLNQSFLTRLFFWQKLISILGVLMGILVISIGYTINYNNYQRKQWVNRSLQRINFTSKEKEEYWECLENKYIQKIQIEKGGLKEKEEILANCHLNLAIELAKERNYVRAIEILLEVAKNGFYKREIQDRINTWSVGIIELATEIYQETGDLEKATYLLDKIPESATVKLKALDLINQLSIETDISKDLLIQATKAIEEKKWQQAKNRAKEVLKVSKSQKWQAEANQTIAIANEKIAKQLLDRARKAIATENWQEARRLAGEIKKNGDNQYIIEAEQIIKTASQKIEQLEPGNNKPVFHCDRELECTQLY